MKLLLIEPYGGRMGHFALFATHLAQELCGLGHEVLLVTGTRIQTHEFLDAAPRFRLVEVGLPDGCLSARSSRMPRLLRKVLHGPTVIRISWAAISRAIEICAAEPFDGVYLMDWEAFSMAALLHRYGGGGKAPLPRLVLHINPPDFSFGKHYINPPRGIYKVLARTVLRHVISRYCSGVTVQGEWHRKRIQEQFGFREADSPRFHVVPPPTLLPETEISQPVARRALGLDPEATVFLFFGMLRRDKGIETLLAAAAGLAGNWQLLVAGSPFDWTEAALKRAIAAMATSTRILTDIRYIPEPEVEEYFSAADAVVLPYTGRGHLGNFGPMIQACGYGRPLIVSDVGEMGWLVRHHGPGYAVAPDDAGALRAAMDSFLHLSEEARSQMRARARWLAVECSFTRMAEKVSDIFGDGRAAAREERQLPQGERC